MAGETSTAAPPRRAGKGGAGKGGAGKGGGGTGAPTSGKEQRAGSGSGEPPALAPWAVASALGLGLAFFGLADWTWQAATAPLVDAGRDPYVAWRLVQGDVLYADIAYPSGPLPAWLLALVFQVAGAGIRQLIVWNAILTAISAGLLYRSVLEFGGRLAAFVATLGFLVLFAFAHYESEGGHGWLSPVSQAAPLSVLLALLTLGAMRRYRRERRTLNAAWIGGIVGLALLTSPQATLACSAAALGGGVALAYGRRSPVGEAGVHSVAGLGGIALPLAIARIALGLKLPAQDANSALFTGLSPLLHPEWLDGPLASATARGLGLEAPGHFLLILLVATVLWLLLLAPATAAALQVGDGVNARIWGGVSAFLVYAGAGVAASYGWPADDWVAWGAPLLIVPLAVLVRCASDLRDARADEDGPEVDRLSGLLAFALAALGLLSTTGLRARLFGEGTTAGVLAFALAVLVLLNWLPRRIEKRGQAGWVLRGAALGLLAVLAVAHLQITYGHVHGRNTPLGEGADRILVEEAQATVLGGALEAIASQVPVDGRLLVVPEGALLNYLSRRKAASPQLSLAPPALARVGEAQVLEALVDDPPEFVLVVDRETRGLGARAFGRDYAQVLGAWIEQHYEPTETFGATPFAGAGFGAQLRKREASLDPPPPDESEDPEESEDGGSLGP